MSQRFEDLRIWQFARKSTAEIYRVSSEGTWSKDFGLRDQIRGASVSVMANIAEGYERRTDREFLRFLDIAKASAGEVRSHLYVALDVGYITIETFDYFKDLFLRLIGMITAFITSVSSNSNSLSEERADYFVEDYSSPESLNPFFPESESPQ